MPLIGAHTFAAQPKPQNLKPDPVSRMQTGRDMNTALTIVHLLQFVAKACLNFYYYYVIKTKGQNRPLKCQWK